MRERFLMRGYSQKMDVYITDTASFLPNDPVSNDKMELALGKTSGLTRRVKRIILRNNGIKSRYYAVDLKTGKITHTNAKMTAAAILKLKPYPAYTIKDIEVLCCGTSTPDQLMPGHASMVHGELGNPPCEAVSTSGICCSGITALKYGFAGIAAGLANNAVATGSDIASTYIRSQNHANKIKGPTPEDDPVFAFSAEFLRWMMSDGAGAVFLSGQPAENRLSLRIDWIEFFSFANELKTCMYAGATKRKDGSLKGWREFSSLQDVMNNRCFSIQQDVKLLDREALNTGVNRTLPLIIKKRGLSSSDIDWFLPHYSSVYFKDLYYNRLKEFGLEIPHEKWFTNLTEKGNSGAASFYIILDEFYRSGRIKEGDHLLCFIPESGRFAMCYMMLTVVSG